MQLTDGGGLSSVYTCLVNLEDVNDQPPIFTQPEDFSVPIYIERVRVSHFSSDK